MTKSTKRKAHDAIVASTTTEAPVSTTTEAPVSTTTDVPRSMPSVGTVLKHGDETAVVCDGGIEYGGKLYTSLSGAGAACAVKLGINANVNGWRFWGIGGDSTPRAIRGPSGITTATKAQMSPAMLSAQEAFLAAKLAFEKIANAEADAGRRTRLEQALVRAQAKRDQTADAAAKAEQDLTAAQDALNKAFPAPKPLSAHETAQALTAE